MRAPASSARLGRIGFSSTPISPRSRRRSARAVARDAVLAGEAGPRQHEPRMTLRISTAIPRAYPQRFAGARGLLGRVSRARVARWAGSAPRAAPFSFWTGSSMAPQPRARRSRSRRSGAALPKGRERGRDAIGTVGPLQLAGHLVQLVQATSLAVGSAARLGRVSTNALDALRSSSALRRRAPRRTGRVGRVPPRALVIAQQVDLVRRRRRGFPRPDLLDTSSTAACRRSRPLGLRGVDNVDIRSPRRLLGGR